ncbi:putative porin [Paraburkholderia bannensis]|uniref:Putative porin n=1 Tax=Paraburkholderia bannensis TaxID=765414 RepID=A0A7W9WUZ2_9BURK|nr:MULTISPECIES: porin [Paraburkholderia]MBB3259814.1 putative porin [Paraburkholderia sp. WP4_3_2]MBB6104876.1 putative porin [Paraburkholderia bannensis]
MKKTTAAIGAALLALSAQSAFAQSSVTLYGLVDTAIRYQTNANAANDGLVEMREGAITPSRWGLKGSEDLGGGLAAVFKLENQFNLWNGKLSNTTNTLFQRNAYVGLSSQQYGTLTFGRQQTPFFEEMGNTFDPLTVADYWQDSWAYNPVGPFLFTNSSAKYTNTIGGLHVEAMYGFGGVAGSTGENSMYGLTASYTFGPVAALVGWQQNDVAGKKFNLANVGLVYSVTPAVRLLAGWLHSQDNSGTVDQAELQTGSLPTSAVSPNRIDDNFYVGTTWQATAPLAITLAGYYGHARNASLGNGSLGNGINYSATLLAEYSLSKRTEVYGTVDFTRGTGAYTIDYPGRNNQTGVAIGLRNLF